MISEKTGFLKSKGEAKRELTGNAISVNKTKVSFLTYVFDDSKLDKGAANDIDKVEREDEFIVENVNKGIKSSFYKSGRYSPTREQGVHHFHRLIAQFIN